MYNEHIDKITERTDFSSTDSKLDLLKMDCANTINPIIRMWKRDFIENIYDKEDYQNYLDEITQRETLPEYEEEFQQRRFHEIVYHCDLIEQKEELLTKYESECESDV